MVSTALPYLLLSSGYTPPYSPPPETIAKAEEEATDPLPVEEDAEAPDEPPDVRHSVH